MSDNGKRLGTHHIRLLEGIKGTWILLTILQIPKSSCPMELHQEEVPYPQAAGVASPMDPINWPMGTQSARYASPTKQPHPLACSIFTPTVVRVSFGRQLVRTHRSQPESVGLGKPQTGNLVPPFIKKKKKGKLSGPAVLNCRIKRSLRILPQGEQEVWSRYTHRKSEKASEPLAELTEGISLYS